MRYLFIIFLLLISCDSRHHYQHPSVEGGMVVMETGNMQDRKPEFYSLEAGNKDISFFIMKNGDSVESYLDACENCYRFKKGYSVDGEHIVCNHCYRRYTLDSLDTGIGSCHPMPVKGELKGSRYYISMKDLEKAADYF